MLTRKLLKNFIERGKMTTTAKKIKLVKQQVEKLIQLAKKDTQASRTLLKKKLADKKIENVLIKNVAPVFKDKISGFTVLIHLNQRDSDGAVIARLEWSLPVVLEKPVKKVKKQKEPEKDKTSEKPAKTTSKKTKKI